MGFEIGKTVAEYDIVGILGSDKSSVAYKVKNVFSQRLEVLKVLAKEVSDNEEQVIRFLREIKVHASLVHPNIVTSYNARGLKASS
jgi:serine/threonine-protein kinase